MGRLFQSFISISAFLGHFLSHFIFFLPSYKSSYIPLPAEASKFAVSRQRESWCPSPASCSRCVSTREMGADRISAGGLGEIPFELPSLSQPGDWTLNSPCFTLEDGYIKFLAPFYFYFFIVYESWPTTGTWLIHTKPMCWSSTVCPQCCLCLHGGFSSLQQPVLWRQL